MRRHTDTLSLSDRSLVTDVRAYKRRALAKAITLIESRRSEDQARAQAVLEALLPYTGQSIRIGISGPPGVGKSTFIEALGLHVLTHGHRIAVLAIDPSSARSGGSILGDKTRMERLSMEPNAFIRPTASGGAMGGVAEKTREALLVCEAAGFDIIVVETVGVGQSETNVAGMVDLFVLLQSPHAGDELQGIKRGITELADMIVINKMDIDIHAAELAQRHLTNALTLLHTKEAHWQTPVILVSALQHLGIEQFWQEVIRYRARMQQDDAFEHKRQHQSLDWMWTLIDHGIKQMFREHPLVNQNIDAISRTVAQGSITPAVAAHRLLNLAKGVED